MSNKPPFNKILIANRGEIAVRVIHACQELGIQSVAVYSEADAESPHVLLADQAVCIGPPAPSDSYLKFENILQAAKDTSAEAIHPGYGFLSENADFAQAVENAGLVFIGPQPAAIRAMGDKGEARKLMEKAGVPLVPGYQGKDEIDQLIIAAEEIGYPVMLKAVAGGGGKGMRIVWDKDDLPDWLAAARREAKHAFGDDRMILEKYIAQARHIEFQILADQHGNILHLFERECSIQRRHQKVIEETPSPLLDAELRKQMGQAAIQAAQAVKYSNAGTVEFIFDPDTKDYFFLEMNTRLQVEHPITELTTGLDLVQWQIRIAAGESLTIKQEDLRQQGHAIEARLYAEDPGNNFFPDTGKIHHFILPDGPGVRVDCGIQSGSVIGLHYDPMLAKIVVHAEDRPKAVRKMIHALNNTLTLGITTNSDFLVELLKHPVFQAGEANTAFIEQYFEGWQPDISDDVSPTVLITAALAELQSYSAPANGAGTKERKKDPYSPWERLNDFRIGSKKRGNL